MNKKADGFFSTIVKIIIILLLILLIANFLGINLWKLGKSALGLTEDFVPIQYTEIDNQAKKTFDNMVRDIEECKNSKNKSCGCNIDLSGYYKTHILWFEANEIKLLNIKNIGNIKLTKDSGITIASNDQLKNLNCFLKGNFKEETFNYIYFKEENPKIWITNLLRTDPTIYTEFQLYKTEAGKLCWLTNKLNKNEFSNIKECS